MLSWGVRKELVPYSNHAVVASPFGNTAPFRVELLSSMSVAACVVTEGEVPAIKEAIFL